MGLRLLLQRSTLWVGSELLLASVLSVLTGGGLNQGPVVHN